MLLGAPLLVHCGKGRVYMTRKSVVARREWRVPEFGLGSAGARRLRDKQKVHKEVTIGREGTNAIWR